MMWHSVHGSLSLVLGSVLCSLNSLATLYLYNRPVTPAPPLTLHTISDTLITAVAGIGLVCDGCLLYRDINRDADTEAFSDGDGSTNNNTNNGRKIILYNNNNNNSEGFHNESGEVNIDSNNNTRNIKNNSSNSNVNITSMAKIKQHLNTEPQYSGSCSRFYLLMALLLLPLTITAWAGVGEAMERRRAVLSLLPPAQQQRSAAQLAVGAAWCAAALTFIVVCSNTHTITTTSTQMQDEGTSAFNWRIEGVTHQRQSRALLQDLWTYNSKHSDWSADPREILVVGHVRDIVTGNVSYQHLALVPATTHHQHENYDTLHATNNLQQKQNNNTTTSYNINTNTNHNNSCNNTCINNSDNSNSNNSNLNDNNSIIFNNSENSSQSTDDNNRTSDTKNNINQNNNSQKRVSNSNNSKQLSNPSLQTNLQTSNIEKSSMVGSHLALSTRENMQQSAWRPTYVRQNISQQKFTSDPGNLKQSNKSTNITREGGSNKQFQNKTYNEENINSEEQLNRNFWSKEDSSKIIALHAKLGIPVSEIRTIFSTNINTLNENNYSTGNRNKEIVSLEERNVEDGVQPMRDNHKPDTILQKSQLANDHGHTFISFKNIIAKRNPQEYPPILNTSLLYQLIRKNLTDGGNRILVFNTRPNNATTYSITNLTVQNVNDLLLETSVAENNKSEGENGTTTIKPQQINNNYTYLFEVTRLLFNNSNDGNEMDRNTEDTRRNGSVHKATGDNNSTNVPQHKITNACYLQASFLQGFMITVFLLMFVLPSLMSCTLYAHTTHVLHQHQQHAYYNTAAAEGEQSRTAQHMNVAQQQGTETQSAALENTSATEVVNFDELANATTRKENKSNNDLWDRTQKTTMKALLLEVSYILSWAPLLLERLVYATRDSNCLPNTMLTAELLFLVAHAHGIFRAVFYIAEDLQIRSSVSINMESSRETSSDPTIALRSYRNIGPNQHS